MKRRTIAAGTLTLALALVAPGLVNSCPASQPGPARQAEAAEAVNSEPVPAVSDGPAWSAGAHSKDESGRPGLAGPDGQSRPDAANRLDQKGGWPGDIPEKTGGRLDRDGYPRASDQHDQRDWSTLNNPSGFPYMPDGERPGQENERP